jgi:hypothetical protein
MPGSVASASAGGPARFGRCGVIDTVIYGGSHLRVVVYRVTLEGHDTYLACATRTGRRRVIQRIPVSGGAPVSQIDGVYAQGTWLAWSYNPDAHTVVTRTLNVNTGARGPAVRLQFGAAITPTDGPPPPTDATNGLVMNTLVITTTGNYAWISTGTSPGSATQQDALYVPTRNGSDRAIDTAPHGGITGLRAQGKTIYWHHAGAFRHAFLP